MRPIVLIMALGSVGCSPQTDSTQPHIGFQRDPEAVVFKLHNLTKVELVLKMYVRQHMGAVPLTEVVRLPSSVQTGQFETSPDVELQLFRSLPLKPGYIGAYSVEVMTDDSESRLGVVDLSRKEMEEAKSLGRMIIVFRDKGMSVVAGTKVQFYPWMRKVEVVKKPYSGYAPESLRD